MVNKVILIGNLGKDPEFRTLESGASRANFSLATNESYKDKSGQWQKLTEWHDIVAWRNQADQAKNLKKGMQVYIEGKLTHRKWTDKENKDHYITEIQVETMRILEKRENSTYGGSSGNSSQGSAMEEDPFTKSASEDDLPF
ncbi:MAG: single-stranded DNA-binding protein [Saprospiraceae bacterium]|jgi:single-strand DNA-binding protein|nr:single-stranded DNA-binding protein [Saprospiraceae bacterium]MBK7796132.1 single-stranded DNA-binding protein [Saprospiraceae bacterium]MBL0261217.1 single-stranded DNA-binding protein [Saprospiraceae bacterium]